jgi:gliding motility-associated-like protein
MKNKILLLAAFISFLISSSYAQNYQFSALGNNSVTTTCKGTFTANGTYQAGGTYSNNTNKTVTFCSGTPGVPIRISFIRWNLEAGFDYLRIYDGTGTGGTLLGTINGESDIFDSGALFFTSTGTCLTVQLTSDNSVTGYWDAIIGCAPQNCGTNLPASDFCGTAPQICDLNGYCGNTSGWYTRDNGQIDNFVGNDQFCGSIENNSWLTFVASATTATLNVNSSNCAVTTTGIQARVYATNNCSTFTPLSNCVSQGGAGQGGPSGAFTLTATGLTIGTRYYVMIDGYAGNICDYTVTANTGVQVLSFTSSASANQICEGGTASITVNGAIAGSTYSWTASPAGSITGPTDGPTINVNPTVTTVYSVVVTQPNGCLTQTESFTLTVNPKKFTTINPVICQGSSVTVCGQSYSTEGTFTKVCTSSKGCDSTVTINLTVNQSTTPTFTQLGPYCVGATPGTLPTTSNNGITGTWNPSTVSTASQGTIVYTFTPTAGLCATTATMSVSVNSVTTPTFTQLGPYCVGATPGTLPTTSNNGITGTWNPSTVSTASQGTVVYTFTPTQGLCATTATMSVTVNQNIVPTFTQLGPYCVGATPGTLPTTSNNGITGTWNPSTVSTASQGTVVYTFTPTAGLCATTATMSVTVNQNIVPTFTQLGPYCVGATPGTLPTTSNNGITGTWNPSTVSTASQGTVVYTFTPTAGLCATTATMSVTVNQNIVPTFTQLGPYCVGATPGTLPTTSNNGITGTWNPSTVSTASQGTIVYTFTPTAGLCATTATMSVTVNQNIVPTFTQLGPYCVGATPGTLPTTSNNGITGTWNPSTVSIASQGTVVYTFTPTAGLCATTATMSVTVNQNIVPTFTQLGPYCVGATPGSLPTTSNNGITGTWNPSTVSTASQGTVVYTFTPTQGLCATTATMSVTVNQNIVPTFTQLGPYCVGATPGTLPTTSNNGITGTWNPSTVSTASQGTVVYTFTPTQGLCATTATMSVTVNQNIVPTFTQLGPYCVGATPGTLPTTSNNGITGTWNPSTVSTASQGTVVYTFTPTQGLCATTATMSVTVNQNIVPTFTQLGPYCVGATPGTLPTTSNNGITGTWNPSTVSTASQGTVVYTFTPTAGLCATTATMSITINNNPVPTFTQLGPYCVGATPGTLPTTSNNGITGTWNPSTVSTANQGTTIYTFTPTQGQCGTTATMSVTVNQNIVPTFTQLGPYCVGATPGTLPTTSNNGITGTWNPSTVSTASQGTVVYTFTPTQGLCATTTTMSVTVNQNIVPTFTQLGPYCVGATPGTLPTTSNNGITGTWNPSTVSTASQGTIVYTFTPTAGLCATTATMSVSVNQNIVPAFTQLGPYCVGATPGTLPTTSNNGITGTWNPSTISTASQGIVVYTFTPTQGLCGTTATMSVLVNPDKTTNLTRVICEGASVTIGNSVFTTTGNFSVVLNSSVGCDSTVNLNLTVNPVKATLLRDTICEGDSIQVGSQTFYTAGTFVVPLLTSQECDSIVTLELFVNPVINVNLPQVICEGDSVIIGNQVFKTGGQYSIFLQTSKGCDSIIKLNLTVLDTSINTFVTTICDGDSITIGDETYKVAGIYTIVLKSTTGCDSTVILDLRIKPTQTTNLTEIICQGESVTVGNLSFSTTGVFTVVLQTFQSCDSTVILDLTVNPISRSTIFEIICEGDSIIVGNQTFNSTGNYTITLENAAGCDSIINLDLVVNPIATTNIVKSICRGEAEIIGNQVFTETGNYTVVLQTSTNCDSTVNLDLTVVEPVITELNFKVCQGETIAVGDSIYSTTGTYSNTLNSAAGCDSIVNLNLIVDPAITTPLTTSICDGDSLTIGNQTFKVEGAYSVVLQSAAGCDSTVNLNLTVNSVTRTSISRSICSGDNFVVGNETFTETGEYTIVLQSALGCDSTVLLNLLVNNLPNIDAVADQPTVNIGEAVQLNVTTSETLTYNWTPADLVSNSEIQNPTAVLNESTWFYVTATNGQTQCRFTDSVFVELNELSCSKENVFIPNAFTPNGDEVNDIFIPRSVILKSMKLLVVDRWGHEVFESNDINVGWDGNYKGQPAQVDSYGYYFIGECSQGEKITIKGNVSLLR